MTQSVEQLHYGTWTTDDAELPVFDLHVADDDAPDMPFRHLLATGRLSAMADRWGNVNLFTTEGGMNWLNPPNSCLARSSIYLMLETEGELVSLLHSELTEKQKIRIGTSYIEYHGEIKTTFLHLKIVQEVFAAPDNSRLLHARFTVTNLQSQPLTAKFMICADVNPSNGENHQSPPRQVTTGGGFAAFPEIHRDLGTVFLLADESWQGTSGRKTLQLVQNLRLEAGKSFTAKCLTGYGGIPDFTTPTATEARRQWQIRLQPFTVNAPEEWMRQECLWNAGQLLSFTSYDNSVNEYYTAIGGYGWESFGVREPCETSMVLAECDWQLTAASLRFVAKLQLANGDILKGHNMRRGFVNTEFESDNELWFIIGICESLALAKRDDLLDEVCEFHDGGEGAIWEHLRRAFYWIRDGVGRGAHGLILIREGDWNDYLSQMGAKGCGESVMNSGMACMAFDRLSRLATKRDETDFAKEVTACAAEIRTAVNATFDQGWFLRGYTDAGQPVGSYAEDRLFINAQSWCALGKCGTAEQRSEALRNAVAKCHTDIGLMLMSRPYSSPAPMDISLCAIPAGEGENAGIWPQTIYWMVWALAEEGMLEEALQEWQCGTLRNHSRRFPQVPFGIFNGPDCFSSKWAGRREGWTQTQLLNRAQTAPMNPMIAWQGFAMRRILSAQSKKK